MKIGPIIIADAAIAVLAVVLWSPIVGLSPTDPDLLRAAAAITSFIAVPAALFAVNRPLLGLGAPQRRELHLLDVSKRGDESGQGDELLDALREQAGRIPGSSSSRHKGGNPAASRPQSYSEQISAQYAKDDASAVGQCAAQAARQVDAARRKRHQIIDMLSNGKLTPGSLAWQRFATGIDEAESTIRSNAALVLSACSSFDDADYTQLVASIKSGSYRSDNIDDELQLQRLSVYRQTIARMQDIINNNERLLLELDNFASEVSLQSMTPSDASSERMLTEMRTLIDEARQYS